MNEPQLYESGWAWTSDPWHPLRSGRKRPRRIPPGPEVIPDYRYLLRRAELRSDEAYAGGD